LLFSAHQGATWVLGAVPLSAESRQGPRHLDVLTCSTLLQAGVDQLQAPVVGDPCGTAVRCQGSALPWRWVEGEPIGLSRGGQSDAFRLLETVVITVTVRGDCDSSRWNSTAGIPLGGQVPFCGINPGGAGEPAIGTYREISTTFPAAPRRSGT
jgi:hypothetical protein